MEFKKVKAAIIGAGMISGHYLNNIKNRFSIIELVGISDIVPEKIKGAGRKIRHKADDQRGNIGRS